MNWKSLAIAAVLCANTAQGQDIEAIKAEIMDGLERCVTATPETLRDAFEGYEEITYKDRGEDAGIYADYVSPTGLTIVGFNEYRWTRGIPTCDAFRYDPSRTSGPQRPPDFAIRDMLHSTDTPKIGPYTFRPLPNPEPPSPSVQGTDFDTGIEYFSCELGDEPVFLRYSFKLQGGLGGLIVSRDKPKKAPC